MSLLIQCTLFLLVMVHSAISAILDPVRIPGNGETGTCPAQESRDAAIQSVNASVRMIVQNSMITPNLAIFFIVDLECGIV